MGDVYWGIHLPLVALIRARGIKQVVETGTFFGQGATQLSALFDRVWTIERVESLHRFCMSLLASELGGVEFLLGDSAEVLRELCPKVLEPTLFILDAHWFPTQSLRDSSESQCPLVEELSAISSMGVGLTESVVMIDDADMLLRSLPAPFDDWAFPSILQVAQTLQRDLGMECVEIQDDVLIGGPKWISEIVSQYRELKRTIGAPGGKKILNA